jgi:Secretion system C-terminal sorting domain
LKKLLYILVILFGINFTSFAQSSAEIENAGLQVKFIKTFPNPASTVVNFVFQKGYNRSYSIQILNAIGKQMYRAKYIPSSLTIDLREEHFFRGVYIYQLLDRNNIVVESGKFLVVN